jgi:hypothetical protein
MSTEQKVIKNKIGLLRLAEGRRVQHPSPWCSAASDQPTAGHAGDHQRLGLATPRYQKIAALKAEFSNYRI